MPTRREQLAEMLMLRDWTAKDLARQMQLPISTILLDLEHVQKSYAERFVLDPARCMACDFEFDDRRKLSTPSRCPKCRSERTAGPWLHIEEEDA